MDKHLKLTFSLLSAIVITSTLYGCGSTKSADKNAQDKSSTSSPSKAEELKLPITNDKITLKYFVKLDSKVGATMKSYNEILAYQELEKKSGIHIDFQHPPVGQDKEQFNLLLASKTLPDIAYYTWLSIPGGPAKAINDKSIIRLNELIDQYAPNFKKILESNPEVRKQATLDDGTIYMFPMLWVDPNVRINYGLQIRKDWLDKLGLKVPQNVEDWYNVLKAFREKDPNGNGNPKDEIPFVSTKKGEYKYLSGAWGINAVDGFYQVNGKVKYSTIEPQFKDYLETLAKWYKEGLIDPEYASTDDKGLDSKITSEKGGAYVGALSLNMGRYLGLVTPKNPKFDLAAAPWPKGQSDKPYTTNNTDIRVVPGHGAAISANNKNLKETVKWLDYFYSQEGSDLFSWGVEGESYTLKNGKPQFVDKITKNPDGLPMDQAVSKYALPHAPIPGVRNKDANWALTTTLPQQIEAVNTWKKSDTSLLLPPLTPSQEDSARLASILNEVQTYESEFVNKIIMGVEPIGNLDKHVKTIKSMGIEEAIKIMQTTLDRYSNKK